MNIDVSDSIVLANNQNIDVSDSIVLANNQNIDVSDCIVLALLAKTILSLTSMF
jgi:hypothetical protein